MSTKKIKVSELPEFDMTDYLSDDKAIAQYLSVVLEENDFDEFKQALNTVAKARSMGKVATKAKVSRVGAYKALKPESRPQFQTIASLLNGIGLKLVVEPSAH